MAQQEKSVTKVYPMDSKGITVDPETGVLSGDRMYNASNLRELHRVYYTDGVVADMGDELAVTLSGGSWTVGIGSAMASGLLMTNDEAQPVIATADIPSGQYAYIVFQARFDTANRDGLITSRLSTSASDQPIRTESVHELILARVNWRGQMTDLRMDPAYCGPLSFRYPVDTDSFMAELKTAVSQFDLAPGAVSALPAGATPTVSVRKPPVFDGTPVYVDFGIPRGEKGESGRDGQGIALGAERPDPPVPGQVFLHDGEGHVIDRIESYEVAPLYPGPETFPGPDTFPGGTGQWVSHTLDASLVQGGAA